MENVLVTGGAGFIGSNFIRYILASQPAVRVVNLDLLTYAGSLQNLKKLPDPKRHIFKRGDINDRQKVEKLIRAFSIDTIIHFAAETFVDRSIAEPEKFILTNVLGTFNLLEAARKVWIGEKLFPPDKIRFHHISTDEVFGALEPSDPPFLETNPYQPRSPYAASKAASDHLVNSYYHTYGLPITITNCSNNYGPAQFPEKLIPKTIKNALNGMPIPIFGDGKQIRDWLYVEDHCRAIEIVIEKGRVGDRYNVGGNNQITNLDLAESICKFLDEQFPDSKYLPHANMIQFVTDRPGHDRRYAMDTQKIQSELGWHCREDMQSGLLKTINWFKDNLQRLNDEK